MTNHDLLDILGEVKGAYILQAQQHREGNKKIIPFRPRNRFLRNIAAIAAIVLICAVLMQTPIGAAAVEMVKEGFSKLIDTLFPPKEIVIAPEGIPEAIPHEAQGRDPEENTMGFAIYVDTENYVMTEEHGAYYIRPIYVNPDLPACEMEIREYPDIDPMTLGQQTKAQYEADGWDMVGDLFGITGSIGCSMDVSNGMTPLDAQEGHYFRDNGKGGTFHIVYRYFLEAIEGHGTRFAAMYSTFTLIAPQDTSDYTGGDSTLLAAMQMEMDYALEHSQELYTQMTEVALTQADMNAAAEQRYTLWLDTFDKLWKALEQTLDQTKFEALTEEQLDWNAVKASVIAQKTADAGGGSITALIVFDASATMMEERCTQLLAYLEGTAPINPRAYTTDLSPVDTVNTFVESYFEDNIQINTIKGMEDYVQTHAQYGRLDASVEFRPTPDSDYFQYLSLTLKWDGQWKVAEYGLEG